MAKRARQPARSRTRPSQVARTRGGRAVPQVIQFVRARYDAAQTNDHNLKYWRNADGLSADIANSPEVRRILRNRGRYETANNGYAAGIVDTLANHTIGTGPRLQMRMANNGLSQAANKDLNKKVERRYARWSVRVRLAEKLLTGRRGQATDGEMFLLLINNPRLRHRVKLDLTGVEPEMVTTPGVLLPVTMNAVDGILLDDAGNPIEYHVLKEHPGGAYLITNTFQFDKIPADRVIHCFKVLRAGQHRGVPEIMPSLPLYAQLRQYTQSVIGSADQAARLTGAMYTKELPQEGGESPSMGDKWEIEPGTFPILPDGYELAQIKAEQPTTTYGDFKGQILNEIARPVSMPRNIAQCDSSNYNYSSGRLDHGTYFNGRQIEQYHLSGDACMEKIFDAWIAEAVLVYEDLAPLRQMLEDDEEIDHLWQFDAPGDIDEEKTANARQTRLQSGQTSFQREFARLAVDGDQEMEQMAKDLGITLEEYQALLREKLFGQAAGPASGGRKGQAGDTNPGDGSDVSTTQDA